ncbi:Uncharacterised protein [Mycobacterium tuberculosis]|nr:Uncharacterised protein [Mycobacterium tuberculosis]
MRKLLGITVFLNENSLVNWKSLFRIIEVWTLKNMKKRSIWT